MTDIVHKLDVSIYTYSLSQKNWGASFRKD